MTATCSRCIREGAEHPFGVPGPPFTAIEVALMDQHYLSEHGERIVR